MGHDGESWLHGNYSGKTDQRTQHEHFLIESGGSDEAVIVYMRFLDKGKWVQLRSVHYGSSRLSRNVST